MTSGEVCRLLRISPATLSNWARGSVIGSITLPSGHRRYRRTEVEAIARGEVPA